jgi:Zn-dependent protease
VKNRSPLLDIATHCVKLGRAFGIDIRIHWTFWILPITFAIAFSPLGLKSVAAVVVLLGIFYGCVVLHEYGHALTARVFGVRTRDIILTPIGGIARLEMMPNHPFQEILIALAGPAVSLMIFLGLLFLVIVGYPEVATHPKPPTLENGITGIPDALVFLMLGNLFLALFNMLPAFPSDGGRVFRAVLELFLSRLRATEIAVYVGAVVALGLAVVGLVNHAPQLPLIAILFAFVGQMELWMVRRQSESTGSIWAESHELLPDEGESIHPPEPDFTGYAWDPSRAMWVEWRNGLAIRQCRTHGW